MPAYRTYIETANMSKVNAAYENAIRVVRDEYAKDTSRLAIGLTSTFPTEESQWLEILNPGEQIEAPGGGPMYDIQGKKKLDYDATGAIRINVPKKGGRVDIFRPAYGSLKPLRARVERDDINIKEL
jgi:hypothetical protein